MKFTYNFYIVVNGLEHQMILQETVDTEEQASEQISTLKDVESISLATTDGLLLSINGIQYKDVHFIARKEQAK